jgi:hypothetical protein
MILNTLTPNTFKISPHPHPLPGGERVGVTGFNS